MRSTDDGDSWKVLEASPATPAYPVCFVISGRIDMAPVAFGRNHTLHYGLNGYDDTDGGGGPCALRPGRHADMKRPRPGRPFMPGYGTLPSTEGGGLLPWSWAEERLITARDYWVASILPDGGPHVMPMWGAWLDGALWISSSGRSRKARNLAADPRCTMTTDIPVEENFTGSPTRWTFEA